MRLNKQQHPFVIFIVNTLLFSTLLFSTLICTEAYAEPGQNSEKSEDTQKHLTSQQNAAGTFDLSEYRGKVVYLDFWASWCIPCKKSFPFMNELKTKFEQDGLAVVAVNVDTKRSLAENFLEQHPANFEIIYDAQQALYEQYQLQGMPTSFLFDRNGQLIGSHVGFKLEDAPLLSSAIEDLLSAEAQ